MQKKENKLKTQLKKLNEEILVISGNLKNWESENQFLVDCLKDKKQLEEICTELKTELDLKTKALNNLQANYQDEIFYLKDELKEIRESQIETETKIQRSDNLIAEKNSLTHFLKTENQINQEKIRQLSCALQFKEELLSEKVRKTDFYSAEIVAVNKKIIKFKHLMEKLINENKRLNSVLRENYKNSGGVFNKEQTGHTKAEDDNKLKSTRMLKSIL